MFFETSHIIWNLINFIVLLVFLYMVAGKPISNMIRSKQEKISSSLTNVEERLSEVNKKLEGNSVQLEQVKNEIRKIGEQAQVMSNKLYEDVVKSAHEEAEKVREQMKKSMEQDIARSKRELRNEVVEKALLKAHELVRQKLDKNTQIRMIESFAISLDNKNASNN